jgi:PAS domain S-box-containing protein
MAGKRAAPAKRAGSKRAAARPKRAAAKPGARRIRELEDRLREAEDTLDAIRQGHVDALVVAGPEGEQVFTLRGAERPYRQLVETMNEGALIVAPDGAIMYSNARFAALAGVPLDRMIGASLAGFVEPGARHLVAALLEVRDGTPAKAEVELVGEAGARTPVYLSASPGWDEDVALTCVIVTDLSDQKRTQAMLAAERLTAQIVDQATEGIVVCDLAGVVVRASHAAHRVAGSSPLLRAFGDVFALRGPGQPAVGHAVVARALAGETIAGLEATLLRDGREPIDLLLSAGPIASSDREVLGCVISFVDITDRKRAAEERLRLLDAATAARVEAEAANRAKDEFLAMLGHELRNPLAPIQTALELMMIRGDDRTRREREVIARQVTHMVRLVGDLLDVSRIARGKIQLERAPVALTRVIDKAIEAAVPLIEERHHALAVDVAPDLWLEADETRICQVISNLLTNAAKYTDRGGRIELRARRDGGDLVITVRDNGIGIAPALLPHLFDLFVQGKRTIERAEGGLGLGLAIVRSLVALHGGRVTARSDGPGRGSEVEVRLPALEHGAAPAARAPAPIAAARAAHRILVVDDNVDAADLLAELLAGMGYETRTVYDGRAALAADAEFAPDIALLDIGLPELDGYEVARRLRARGRPVRLVALTGYGRDTDRAAALAAGFDAHLVKPVELTALDAALRA